MGGKCKWVVLTNIQEIRFYPALDRSKCQKFFLRELCEQEKLKELLFLFHRDHLVVETGNSKTDRFFEKLEQLSFKDIEPRHIVDEIYFSLKRFEGFGFVDPNYLASIKPFNILEDYVWHYLNGNLLTINPKIYSLLDGLEKINGKFKISENLLKEMNKQGVIDGEFKINWSFEFLNNCFILKISAIKNYKELVDYNKKVIGFSHRSYFQFKEGVDGITKDVNITDDKECDCISCNYRNLDFKKIFQKIKVSIGSDSYNTLEYGYANYICATNSFKSSFVIYKAIEERAKKQEEGAVEYFLAKKNIKNLYGLMTEYSMEDKENILRDIKSIDLEKVIYDEFDFVVDNDVKNYLIQVKGDELYFKTSRKIDKIVQGIRRLKKMYDEGGRQLAGPNLHSDLMNHYALLYLHFNRNFIVYDIFDQYKEVVLKVFEGLLISSLTPEFGLRKLDSFILTEAILHIKTSDLKEVLNTTKDIKADTNCIEELLLKLVNFLESYLREGLFSIQEIDLMNEHLANFRFKLRFTSIFSNIFLILSKMDITKEQFFRPRLLIVKLLKSDFYPVKFNSTELSSFIQKKGNLFENEELLSILQSAIEKDKYGNNRYKNLIKDSSNALREFFPTTRISSSKLVTQAILNSTSNDEANYEFSHLIQLFNICDNERKNILSNAFENFLINKFDENLYIEMVLNTDEKRIGNIFFYKYIKVVSTGKQMIINTDTLYRDVAFYNFILVLYTLKPELKSEIFSSFKNLNDIEQWLIDPYFFDYSKFKAKWLIKFNHPFVLKYLKNNPKITQKLEEELRKEFNAELAEIKYSYFNGDD